MTERNILFGHNLIVKERKAIHPLLFHQLFVLHCSCTILASSILIIGLFTVKCSCIYSRSAFRAEILITHFFLAKWCLVKAFTNSAESNLYLAWIIVCGKTPNKRKLQQTCMFHSTKTRSEIHKWEFKWPFKINNNAFATKNHKAPLTSKDLWAGVRDVNRPKTSPLKTTTMALCENKQINWIPKGKNVFWSVQIDFNKVVSSHFTKWSCL